MAVMPATAWANAPPATVLRIPPQSVPAAYVEAANRFYQGRQQTPLWWSKDGWSERTQLARQVLANAAQDGLNPRDYAPGIRLLAPGAATPLQIARADFLLTATLLRYIADLRNGRHRPHEIDPELHIAPKPADPVALLQESVTAGDFAAWLADLIPPASGYPPMRQALAQMRALEKMGPWPVLPDGPKMEAGQRSPEVQILRQQLARFGELNGATVQNEDFDIALEDALKRFQTRHGLEADGKVGPKTRRAVNTDPATRAKQIILNMERLRWLSADFGSRHVLVNIAGFELRAMQNGKVVLRSAVVVGRDYRRTPVLSDHVVNLVLSPSWTPPPRLAKLDILPKIKANPAYLSEQGFRVYDGWGAQSKELDPYSIDWSAVTADNLSFRFRQDPGPLTALGGIRFSMTNKFSIYLHDTPDKEIFKKSKRSFSSGCIRVEKALELALYMLDNDSNWPASRLTEAMTSAKTRVVKLAKPVPIHIIYSTAWVDEEGILQFREDIYGRDALLRAGLKLDAQG